MSYAREDQAFVHRLHSRLVAGEKTIYVDFRDIPQWSEDWQEELYTHIDSSDTIVVVLSPASATSENVELEIARAVEQHKRLRPILVESVDEDALAPALRRPQWIDFRDDGQFDARLAELLDVLNTDVDWVQGHTRFLLAANEWDGRHEDPSLLLGRSERRDAEDWLTRQVGKEPPATDLQLRFIAASRKAAVRRRRTIIGTGLVVIAVLAVVGFIANSQRDRADTEARAGLSRRVSAEADALRGRRLDTSVLASLAALRIDRNPQAQSGLLKSLLVDDRYAAFLPSTGNVLDTAFTRRGLLSVTEDGQLATWTTAAGRIDGAPVELGRATAAALSPRNGLVALGLEDGGVDVVEIETGRRRHQPPTDGSGEPVSDVAITESGKLVVSAAGVGGHLTVWDVRRDRTYKLGGVFTGALAVDRGGLLAAGDLEGRVLIWDLTAAEPQFRGTLEPGLRASAAAVAFAPSGKLLAAEDFEGAITVWAMPSGQVVASASAGPQPPRSSLRFSADGRVLAATARDDRVAVFRLDASKPTRLRALETGRDVRSLAIDARGDRVVTAADDGMTLWKLDAGPRLGRTLPKSVGYDAALTPDGHVVAMAYRARRLYVWDPRTGALRGERNPAPEQAAFALAPAGDRIAWAGPDGIVRVWDVENRRPLAVFDAARGAIVERIVFDPTGRRLAVVERPDLSSALVRAHDTRTGTTTPPVEVAVGPNARVDFSPDGGLLGLHDLAGQGAFLDLAEGHERALLPDAARPAAVAFSPDGDTLAVAGADGKLALWSRRSRQPIGTLRARGERIADLRFDAEGQMLAVAGSNGPVDLYDVGSRTLLASLPGSVGGSALAELRFAPTGHGLLTIMGRNPADISEGTLTLSDLAPAALVERACELANRDLEPTEWSEIVGSGEPQQPLCPG